MPIHGDRTVDDSKSKVNCVQEWPTFPKGERVLPGDGKAALVIEPHCLTDAYFFTPPPSPCDYEKRRWRNVKGLDVDA